MRILQAVRHDDCPTCQQPIWADRFQLTPRCPLCHPETALARKKLKMRPTLVVAHDAARPRA